MKKLLLSLTLFCFIAVVSAQEITANWCIVCPDNAVPTARQAAREIAHYINQVAGIKLKIVPHPQPDQPQIRVKCVHRGSTLAPEAWQITASPQNITIAGGYPNGVLYGAYEFIEQQLGCRFLAMDAEYIPQKHRLILPDNLALKGQPFFASRHIWVGYPLLLNSDYIIFTVKCRQNLTYLRPEYGFYDRMIDRKGCHTYYLYTQTFPEQKKEYFSMNQEGKRLYPINGTGPGQLCLSAPGVRPLVVKKMAELIARDRKTMAEKHPGIPFPQIIDFSQNDNYDKCECAGCRALQKQYGGKYSGAVLDCTNDVAARIEKIYPGTIVQTFAYAYSEEPPEGIRARDNVRVQLAQLGAEFWLSSTSRRDSLRPLTHPNNRRALALINGWARQSKRLAMWDYWRLYQQMYLFPYTNLASVVNNLRLYSEKNFERVMSEYEMFYGDTYDSGNFFELTYYVGTRLMVDPHRKVQPLIDEFMLHYYQAAEKPMRRLRQLIERGMAQEPRNIGLAGNKAAYLTAEFFEQAEAIFAEAERLAVGNPVLLGRIGQERISFDTAALKLQERLQLKLNRLQVIDRLHRNKLWVFKRYAPRERWKKGEQDLAEEFYFLRHQLPVPAKFKGRDLVDLPWYKMKKYFSQNYCRLVNDAAAAGGKAIFLGDDKLANVKALKDFHTRPLKFGFYDRKNRRHIIPSITVPRERMPQDEKYHWYYLGRTALPVKGTIWVHWSWKLGISCTDTIYDATLPEKQYEIWISLKLQGPAYVPGSKQNNAVSLDRIVLVP